MAKIDSKFNINNYKNILLLTGAGISKDSGLATFRDSNGLWNNHKVEEVATPEAFERNPIMVWTFYSERKKAAAEVNPNQGHEAIAKLIKNSRAQVNLITQNVDNLHQRAFTESNIDNSSMFSMHGEILKSRCTLCHKSYSDPNIYFDADANKISEKLDINIKDEVSDTLRRDEFGIPLSKCCNVSLRPDIVWFGETPKHMNEIQALIKRCDLFLSIGTSGSVYPAASFAEMAKSYGADTALVNIEQINGEHNLDYIFTGSSTELLSKLFFELQD